MNYLVLLSFDGKDYYGTQKLSKNPTIQGIFEELLSKIYTTKIKVKIGSRLDRGVSAIEFGLNYEASDIYSVKRIKYTLNRMLDKKIRVKEVRVVNPDFNVRYDAFRKTYLYVVEVGEENPFMVDRCYHPYMDIDLDGLKRASNLYVGSHCFDYFGSEEEKEGKLLTIESVDVEKRGNYILWRVTGRSFLKYQVRYMVGTALLVSAHKIDISEITGRLNGTIRENTNHKAPPQGLYLEKVEYDFERSMGNVTK